MVNTIFNVNVLFLYLKKSVSASQYFVNTCDSRYLEIIMTVEIKSRYQFVELSVTSILGVFLLFT